MADDRPLFGPSEQLRLLQLQARRVMSERRSKDVSLDVDEGSQADDSAPTRAPVPAAWRLVPEGVPLYAWQQECQPLWLRERRGTIKVATGGGKTRFALAAAQRLQNESVPDLRLVVVVPTIPLMFQWKDELAQSNLPESCIGLMGGEQELPPHSRLRVLICVLASAREKLPAFIHRAGWSERLLLVVDECHRANAEQARRIFESRPAFTLGLSATPEDLDDDGALPSDEAYATSPVGQGLGPILFEFTLRQSLEAGLLTPFEICHVGLPLAADEAMRHGRLSREISELRKRLEARHVRSRSKQGFLAWCQTLAGRGGEGAQDAARFIGFANERKRLLYRASARQSVTLGLLRQALTDPESRVILFHESIGEVEQVFLQAEGRGLPVVLEHSRLPDRLRAEGIEAFRKGVARAIVSAKSLVEGFNVPSADVGVIVASSGSVRQRIQSLGRMLRRKEGGREARIWVLYVRDTEDEYIYQKTDWDHVIGAQVNRYYRWDPVEGEEWPAGLSEQDGPPLRYRPPSREVVGAALQPRSPYPGQADGEDLKVDQHGNLRRDSDRSLVTVPSQLVALILELNRYRRAHLTLAGHLIVRSSEAGEEGWWVYLGMLAPTSPPPGGAPSIELKLGSRSGRRRIIRPTADGERFARGPESLVTALLEWSDRIESQHAGLRVIRLNWDENARYWIEVAGERIDFDGPAERLEF